MHDTHVVDLKLMPPAYGADSQSTEMDSQKEDAENSKVRAMPCACGDILIVHAESTCTSIGHRR